MPDYDVVPFGWLQPGWTFAEGEEFFLEELPPIIAFGDVISPDSGDFLQVVEP